MAEAGTVDVDQKRVVIHYHTGVVTSTRKQKETQIHSSTQYQGNQAVTSTSSSTVDHHELFIVDSAGRERAFNMIDMDLAVREGNTVTVVWVVPTDVEVGPHVKVFNHNTGDSTQVEPKRLLMWFFNKKMLWITTIVAAIVGFLISWVLGIIGLIAPYFYWKSRAMKGIRGMFTSREFTQLQTQLQQVKPAQAVAA
jgi:hypothetical protein